MIQQDKKTRIHENNNSRNQHDKKTKRQANNTMRIHKDNKTINQENNKTTRQQHKKINHTIRQYDKKTITQDNNNTIIKKTRHDEDTGQLRQSTMNE